MASITKFTDAAALNQIRHNVRSIEHSRNLDIDHSKSYLNYSLLDHPDGLSDYGYYKKRKSELYVYGRADVKTLAGWIITAPKSLAEDRHPDFFEACTHFLQERYGPENAIQAIVHRDESGSPHLHYLFIPACQDKKHGRSKICANNVITREDLRSFHNDLQHYLNTHDLSDAHIKTGVTRMQGGNRTVTELKRESAFERLRRRTHERSDN